MTERLHFHFSLSSIGEGNGNPLQCSCLENPRDGGAWWAAVYGVAQSQTRLQRLSSSSSSSSSSRDPKPFSPISSSWKWYSSHSSGNDQLGGTHITSCLSSPFSLPYKQGIWVTFLRSELLMVPLLGDTQEMLLQR